MPAGMYTNLQAGNAGQLFFLEAQQGAPRDETVRGSALKHFDLGKRKTETVLPVLGSYSINMPAASAAVLTL